jgi:hypothetical protein
MRFVADPRGPCPVYRELKPTRYSLSKVAPDARSPCSLLIALIPKPAENRVDRVLRLRRRADRHRNRYRCPHRRSLSDYSDLMIASTGRESDVCRSLPFFIHDAEMRPDERRQGAPSLEPMPSPAVRCSCRPSIQTSFKAHCPSRSRMT